jgi:hypothetical protein
LGIFEDLSSLELLWLNHNSIGSIHEDIFSTLRNIKEISLEDNDLEMLPENLFKFNYKLKILELSRNRLHTIPTKMFSHLQRLETLQLSGNICIDTDYENNANEIITEIETDLLECHGRNHKSKESANFVSSNCDKPCDFPMILTISVFGLLILYIILLVFVISISKWVFPTKHEIRSMFI